MENLMYTKDEVEAECLRIAQAMPDETNSRIILRNVKDELPNIHIPNTPLPACTMIDDEMTIVGRYLPHLVALTRGKIEIVLYQGDGLPSLIESIQQTTGSIALMDYRLKPPEGDPLYGDIVLETLRSMNWNTPCIGFSGDGSARKKFLQSGAQGCVFKSFDPIYTLPNLKREIEKIQRPT